MITIRGANTHNLKNISLELPHDKLIVITGLSGSGKSSLAFDTLYAEGQRRYVESLSAYARQFLDLMNKPDVDSIEGLRPAIAIEQKTTSKNPRSTVGTITEIYDYLRLLYARIGIAYSPATGKPIIPQSLKEMVEKILKLSPAQKCYLSAPFVIGRKGEYLKEFIDLKKRGFQRIKINNEVFDIDNLPEINPKIRHNISVVIDRFITPKKADSEYISRITSSLETALDFPNGIVEIDDEKQNNLLTLSSKFSCPVSGFSIKEIEPRLFSFNSPHGACSKCFGLGVVEDFDHNKIIHNPNISIADGAIPVMEVLEKISGITPYKILDDFKVSIHTPFKDIALHIQNKIIFGSETPETIKIKSLSKTFQGIIPTLQYYVDKDFSTLDVWINMLRNNIPCNTCLGNRLNEEALSVKINNKNIADVTKLSIEDAYTWISNLELSEQSQKIAERIISEIKNRFSFLIDVGLNYLNLSRIAGTLSGGESQRIRLASQIGSGLTGVLYVLDEPSIGLHQRDNDRLLQSLKRLRDLGNTVVVVEHDEDAIRSADYVLDIGPGAGVFGGHIVAYGTPNEIENNPKSLTGEYLSHKKEISIPKRRSISKKPIITLKNVELNNLKNIEVKFPLKVLTCVTGVSGSGKSSLIMGSLYPAISSALFMKKNQSHNIEGAHNIDKIINITQSPIGRTPRSNPATYIGCFSLIRDWYAGLPESKARGYAAGRFSFNVTGGRCDSCNGDGIIKIEMHFLPDVYVKCENCNGRRYKKETLNILYNGKNIADILDMTVDEATIFFQNQKSIHDKLTCLQKVGLGYIHLGQQATTLSGGEAQRIKLAKELSKKTTGKTFYILDEPTTGLHFEDINKLLEILQKLVDKGNTVLMIEHNLDVIKVCDWIIDIGPEGGKDGGQVVAQGTPEEIVKIGKGHTYKYLKEVLNKNKS